MEKRVDSQLERFWELEDLPSSVTTKDAISEHVLCEKHFKETTKRDSSGHYVVNLPLKENIKELGESKEVAETRFLQMESKLKRNPVLYKSYSKFMEEYEQLGHMEKVHADENNFLKTYYIPHLPVIREESSTTKLRVVFDASSKSSSGLSLNDTLMVGPTIQRDVFSILCRFRCHKYALTADIEKMYRGILVDEDQRDLQRILWRSDSKKPIELYRLNTVTYGTAAAPWLAIRTLHELAMQESSKYPIAAPVLMNDFYVDDLMTGAKTVEDGKQLFIQMDQILRSGGFNIRKWNSNSLNILGSIPVDKQAGDNPNQPHRFKVLGMEWNSKTDCFNFSIKVEKRSKTTKRTVLSEIASLFDPLGLLGPVILKAKLFLQELWKLKLNWDESLSAELHSSWQVYREQMSLLKEVQIDRHVKTSQGSKTEVHGFCDSSIRAYGACIYVRTVESNGKMRVRLLCSKSKVSPLKTTTIPRLELCGALLLARLFSKVKSLGIPHESCKLWCDSTIVLSWIQSQPSKFKPFVSNRITEIQKLTKEDCNWNYVKSSDNPADLVSRGLNPAQIINNSLWWQGPGWLSKEAGSWPTAAETIDLGCQLPEQKQLSLTAGVREGDINTLRFSSLLRLQRVIAFCFRFVNNMKGTQEKQTSPLSSEELRVALNHLIKIEQKYHLKRCVGITSLTFEGMYTALTTIEACLNSRPLVPLSNDPNDLSPLTPGHFLIGESLTAIPEPNLEHLSHNRLSHWQRAQQITQHFWTRWSKEYLSFLQQRPKWRRDAANIKPGQLVVIKDDALPPLKWITARVIDVHPGADGRVRVATVKSTSGTYKRAANRLCVLPIDEP